MKSQTATFAAGCFWGVEEAFRKLNGVLSTRVGYTEGNYKNPTYSDVCSGRTGHAEAVEIKFNPEEISYEKLLETFWKIHNPTTLDRQGPDVTSQYRPVIYYHDAKQKQLAEISKEREQKNTKSQIVTEIVPAEKFYEAEEYHQKYTMKQGRAGCRI